MRNPRNDTVGSATNGEAGGPESGSERRCVLTGRNAPRDALLRLAVSPEGAVLPDALARAPGRGAWLGVTQLELREALASGRLKAALARAFKSGQLELAPDLPERFEQALRQALAARLGLEVRAGSVILGSDRIAGEARMGKVAALYHAADASEDGCRKLDQAWRVGMDAEGTGLAGTRLPLDRDALSVALGRDNVVHVALADARSAGRVSVPLGRLQTYLGATGVAGTRADRDAGSAARASA